MPTQDVRLWQGSALEFRYKAINLLLRQYLEVKGLYVADEPPENSDVRRHCLLELRTPGEHDDRVHHALASVKGIFDRLHVLMVLAQRVLKLPVVAV